MRLCKLEGCASKNYGHGFCRLHWQRWRNHGDPSVCLTPNGRPLRDRFEEKVDRSGGATACHLWVGQLHHQGYGRMFAEGRRRYVHHVSWFLEEGFWPNYLRHACDNPPCVSRAHLAEGTHADNMRDMAERGRYVVRYGEDHHASRLNPEKVAEIRRRRAAGETIVELGKVYGVNHTSISRVCRGVTWRGV